MINILTLSLFVFTTLHIAVAPASAHGYVIFPPSRQALCKDGRVPYCGSVQYTPDAVEAHRGSFKCNGNGPRFHELNNEALWQNYFAWVPSGTRYIPFMWQLTGPTPHQTLNWEYYLINRGTVLLNGVNQYNSTPPLVVTHMVPLYSFTGRQTILARWNIADNVNTFYSCVDLYIAPPRAAMAGADTAVMQQPIDVPLAAPEPELAIPMVPM